MVVVGNFRPGKELRRRKRSSLHREVKIAVKGQPPQSCQLIDISDGGARIQFADEDQATGAPAEFLLLLSGDGRVRRLCQLVRRLGREIGVGFVQAQNKAHVRSGARAEADPTHGGKHHL
jgi:hypothetical protein